MAFHHVAISTRDLPATHAFYTDVMGFTLLRVETAPTPEALFDPDGPTAGWARHVFYDTGGGECLAVWDLHDPEHLPADFDPSISRGLGLPPWTNHVAFDAPTLDALGAHRDRWLAHGLPVVEIDHGWCTSIYAEDPNGITVEFCCTTAEVRDPDAAARLTDPAPPLAAPPEPTFFVPEDASAN
ncbi:MAG: VOC family protein [Actinobacteria bacterium]|nr:VOC family protein [Actinomycetota bacterium]